MKVLYKTICYQLLLLLMTTTAFAQLDLNTDNLEFNPLRNNIVPRTDSNIPTSKTFADVVKEAEGSPYFDNTFKRATISESGNVFNVRYNAFLDEMEIVDGEEKKFINKKYQKHLITFLDTKECYKVLLETETDKENSFGYFVLLADNPYLSLYRKDQKKYVPSRNMRRSDTAEFQNVSTRFYVETNKSGKAILLPRSNRKFLKLFSDKRATIKSYLKREKLNVANEQDLIQLINYINSL